MGFIGTLVVWHGGDDVLSRVSLAEEFEQYQNRGAWTVSYLDDELVGDRARPLLDEICRASESPALTAFVFESDCAFVSGLSPDGTFWSGCLVRGVVAGVDDLDDEAMLTQFGSPEQEVANAVGWARAAGLEPDREALLAAFAFIDADEIFLGLTLVDQMLTALGLPAVERLVDGDA